jgi:hypothetical protein
MGRQILRLYETVISRQSSRDVTAIVGDHLTFAIAQLSFARARVSRSVANE